MLSRSFDLTSPLIPAVAGIQRKMFGRKPSKLFRNAAAHKAREERCRPAAVSPRWIPACAGMSGKRVDFGFRRKSSVA